MKILGIETSCDETAVCLLEAEGAWGAEFSFTLLGNELNSQAALHAEFGGVFPNLAKREHAKNLVPLLEEVLRHMPNRGESSISRIPLDTEAIESTLQREPELLRQLIPFLKRHDGNGIDAIAVTHGPGLEPALWVGINFAKALSRAWNIPIVSVNHMEGHVVLSMMDTADLSRGRRSEFDFPVIALLISGGHTELVLSKSFGEYELIGQTRDDAAGEAFDKVARLLDLPYPGGPEISRLAALARCNEVTPHCTKLPRPMIHEKNFDFSFSGLKTAVRRIVEGKTLTDAEKAGVAREFEDAVADVLVAKTMRAVEAYGVNAVVVGGGVSANTHIRERLADALQAPTGCKLLVPEPNLATDNAIMIALAGYFHAENRDFVNPDVLVARCNLRLSETG